jgi:hypothetical protein
LRAFTHALYGMRRPEISAFDQLGADVVAAYNSVVSEITKYFA